MLKTYFLNSTSLFLFFFFNKSVCSDRDSVLTQDASVKLAHMNAKIN